jgi:hypothetical protein
MGTLSVRLVRSWCRGSLLCLGGWVALLSVPAPAAPTWQVSLEPGAGAILLLGSDQDLAAVQQDYFGSAPRRPPSGPVDRLLLGPISGADLREVAKPFGVSHEEYLDQVLALYAELGATMTLAYRGDMGNGDGKRFAAIAARHGLKAFLEPTDLYWRQPHQQSDFWLGKMAEYGGCEGYTSKYLIPLLEKYAPELQDDENICGWQLTEEIYRGSEPSFTPYKAAFKRLFPKHLLFQIDSQMLDARFLSCKQAPYPDIMAADFYPFMTITRDETQDFYPAPWKAVGLATPHHATQSLYLNLRQYAQAAYDLFQKPAVMVLIGGSHYHWLTKEAGTALGFKAEASFVYEKGRGAVRWVPEADAFFFWWYYMPPEHAFRLQHWIAVACGFKGILYYSLGPSSSPAELEEYLRRAPQPGASIGIGRISLINWDLSTHRHLREVSKSWQELRRYEALLLDAHPLGQDDSLYRIGTAPYVYSNLLRDSAGRTYLVVVNGQIGAWDKDSPEVLTAASTLGLNRYGELENYSVLRTPRTVNVTLSDPSRRPFDLRTLQPLAVVE